MYASLFKKRPREPPVKASETDGGSTAGQCRPSGGGGGGTLRPVYHYPSRLGLPVVMGCDFPSEEYRSRHGEVKTAIHWGQRKLLLSEIQLLSLYARREVSYHIVYAGSAPGTHLGFLDELFRCRHTWELVDPGQFDVAVLQPRQNFRLRNEFFTNATAYGINARRLSEVCPGLGALYAFLAVDNNDVEKREIYKRLQAIVGTQDVARSTHDIPSMYEAPLQLPYGVELLSRVAIERARPLLFVSDIRSGSVALPNFEEHVAENMRAQACWATILHGEFSMLKFRLPYSRKASGPSGVGSVNSTLIDPSDGCVPYLRGDILLPIWTRPTSTEGRLVVPKGAGTVRYSVRKIENQFFFFNARIREQVHFNHILPPDEDLDHHYDAAAEVHCLTEYIKFIDPRYPSMTLAEVRAEVKRLSESITKHLELRFRDAIRRREAIILKQASLGTPAKDADVEEDADSSNIDGSAPASAREATHPQSQRAGEWVDEAQRQAAAAEKERLRVLWRTNVVETDHDPSSGFWVTTTMSQ